MRHFNGKINIPPQSAAGGLRKGFSTGSTSAAAVKASIRYYFESEKFSTVEIKMPGGENARLNIAELEKYKPVAALDNILISKAVLIKDSGDDIADVTGGIKICADFTVVNRKDKNVINNLKKYYEKFSVYNIIKCSLNAPGISHAVMFLASSRGIGIAKRAGLPVKAGFPAINPVPYKMIEIAAEEELRLRAEGYEGDKIFVSVLYVPEGEEIAKKTLNPRLGIEGGISILGTTGYVVPISTKAWLETIKACLNFLSENKIDTCVFTPGRYSEKTALKIFKNLHRESFIEIGDYVAYSVRKAVKFGIKNIVFISQFGKIVIIAQGARNTNAKYGALDLDFLGRTAKEATCNINVNIAGLIYRRIINSNTSREAYEHITSDHFSIYSDSILSAVLKKAAENLSKTAGKNVNIEIILISYDGDEIKKERL